jgi:hypothetical protein
MTIERLFGAVGFSLALTLVASPALAKSSYWYTNRSCQFYPGGGHRTPAETEACQKKTGHSRRNATVLQRPTAPRGSGFV